MSNYRKIYECRCKIKIPKDYEIHHINLNHNDNNIMNLVMLPKKLHSKYHIYLNLLNNRYSIVTKLQSVIENGNGINEYIITEQYKAEKKFIKIWYECQKWVDYRNYLLGIMDNIHKIHIGK